jgi:hypothetical protein
MPLLHKKGRATKGAALALLEKRIYIKINLQKRLPL